MKTKMLTNAPAAKVQAASYAASLTTIVLYLISQLVPNNPLPEAVQIALGVVITGIVTGAITFLAGYITPPRPTDQVVADPPAPPV